MATALLFKYIKCGILIVSKKKKLMSVVVGYMMTNSDPQDSLKSEPVDMFINGIPAYRILM